MSQKSAFSFSPASSPGFTFCAGLSTNNKNTGSKPAKRRLSPSVHNNKKLPSTPPQHPPAFSGSTFSSGLSSTNNNNTGSKPAKRRSSPSVHKNRKLPSTPPQHPPAFSGFTFLASLKALNSTNNSNTGSKPAKPLFSPSVHNSSKSPSTPPQHPPAFSVEKAEDDNATKARNHDEVPETTKTKFIASSAVTGVIPCHFEGSNYSSKLSPTFCTPEQPIKKEAPEKSEPNPPSTQLVLVSRILKGIPQNPHFIPLKAYSNIAKQTLINAWDNIFEETVDNLQSMKVQGFSIDSKRLGETMEELEKMGYNVMTLRKRLVVLSDVWLSQRKRKRVIMRLKNEAEEYRMEKSRLEFEIVKLKAKIEAVNTSVEDVLANITKMEDEVPHFNALFTVEAIKKF